MKRWLAAALACLLLTACTQQAPPPTATAAQQPGKLSHQTTRPSPTTKPTTKPTTPPTATPSPTPMQYSYSTPIVDRMDNRMTNLELAVKALDGIDIAPGAVLSFNDTVGARTPERGYELGKIFKDGEKIDEYGGGICQIATTVYNAALAAGWEIVERHDHGDNGPIPYIEDGKDATVYYGDLDLKVKNNTPHPAKLYAAIRDWTVIITIVV